MESAPRGTVIGANIKQKSAEVGNGVMRDRRGKQMIDRILCTYVCCIQCICFVHKEAENNNTNQLLELPGSE